MARKSNIISILQCDNQLISLLRVHPSSKGIEVLSFDTQRGAWSMEDASLEAALIAFAQKHALADDTLCTVLPRYDVTSRILTLPTHGLEEAASMVRLSAEEFVPYAADELVIDQCILQTLPNGESRVLAVLAHRDVVNAHLALLKKAGLEPERILMSSACLASAVAASLDFTDDPVAVVNLASGGLEIVVLGGARLQYGRGIATVQDWAESPDALNELALEVRGSLAAFRRESEDGTPVDRVYLCSEWLAVTSACETLEHETGKECQPAVFAKRLITKGQEHVDTLPLVSLGAALAAQDRAAISINLLPESMTRVRALEGAKSTFLKGFGLVAVILLALSGLYFQAVHQRDAYIRELQKQIKELEPSARGVTAKQEQLSILRQQVQHHGSALEILASAFKAGPAGKLTVIRFLYNRKDGVHINGRASSIDEVQSFAQTLRDMAQNGLEQLAQAKVVYTGATEERGSPVVAF